MDFTLSEEQQAVFDLAGQIFSDQLTQERFKEVEATSDRVDTRLWESLAKAGLLGVSLPAAYGGGDQNFLATAVLLEQAGHYAAPVPLLATVVMGALPVAQFGTEQQQKELLPGVIAGELMMTAALIEPGSPLSSPSTRATPDGDGWRLDGSKTCVAAGPLADRLLVSATSVSGAAGVFIVDPSADGVSVSRLVTTSGSAEAHIDFVGVVGQQLGDSETLDWLLTHTTSGICSILAGACKEAVRLTAEYAKTREQFDRPIATFQAVGQRAADAYIDAEAVHLTARQAAWRLSEGLPSLEQVAIAKFFAADAGQRVVHAAQHIHGGVGVDRDYPLHRYFVLAKQLELTLGGTTASLLKLGAHLAAEPAAV